MRTAVPQTEKAFQAAVCQLAHLKGWTTFHPFDSRRSASGFPDLTLVRGDRLLFAELKTESGKVSEAQQHWLELLAETPAQVHIWRPSSWPEIESTLA